MRVRSEGKSDWSKTTKTNLGRPKNNTANNRGSDRPRFSLFRASTLKLGVLIARIQTSKRKPKENRRKENNIRKQEVKHQA